MKTNAIAIATHNKEIETSFIPHWVTSRFDKMERGSLLLQAN